MLVSPRNPLNIGAAARAMANFGFDDLRLVNPYEVALAGANAAVGALHVLESARVFTSVPDAVADCELVVGTTAVGARNLEQPIRSLQDAAPSILDHGGTGRVALLFGSEKSGLSNDDLSYCHSLVRIPTLEVQISMNLGQAVAVCLYELMREAPHNVRTTGPCEMAEAAELDRLTSVWLDVLNESEYIAQGGTETAEEKLRRLVRRMGITRRDAPTITGMFRQVLWKLRNPR